MTIEKNKEIIKQYHQAINTKNWELLEDLIHDEYGTHSHPMQDYIREITETGVNPFIEFFRLLGYDDKIIAKVQNGILATKDKQSYIRYTKWLSQYISNPEIHEIIVEKNQVWLYGSSDFLSNTQYKINHSGYQQYILKDSKIIMSFGAGRYLASLMQVGKVVFANDDEEEINKYLQGLRNLGILPEKIKI